MSGTERIYPIEILETTVQRGIVYISATSAAEALNAAEAMVSREPEAFDCHDVFVHDLSATHAAVDPYCDPDRLGLQVVGAGDAFVERAEDILERLGAQR